MLIGALHSNEQVILGDVHLSEWFPDQFIASSRWALIGLSIGSVVGWTTARVRVSGLESVLGNAIAATWWPRTADVDPQRFSVDLNREAAYESSSEGVAASACYEPSFSAADPYQFRLSNFATVTFKSGAPLGVDEWIREWITPLLALTTLATGEQERITSVTLSVPDPEPSDLEMPTQPQVTAHLWGAGIQQYDRAAERRTRSDGSPLVPLFTLEGAPPLAELLRQWRATVADQTAASLYRLAIDPELPTQVRYLLNSQALESLDAAAHVEPEATEDARHTSKREAVLVCVDGLDEEHLDEATKQFIRQNLTRSPYRSLGGRFNRIITRVPSYQGHVARWTSETRGLGEELEAMGRASAPLHERLAAARNALSHGASLTPRALSPANRILEALVRGELLQRLRFNDDQLAAAFVRVARE